MAEGDAVYCETCEMWLNGPTQWEDHRIGKKHRKNLKRQEGTSTTAPSSAPPSKPQSVKKEPMDSAPSTSHREQHAQQKLRVTQPAPDVQQAWPSGFHATPAYQNHHQNHAYQNQNYQNPHGFVQPPPPPPPHPSPHGIVPPLPPPTAGIISAVPMQMMPHAVPMQMVPSAAVPMTMGAQDYTYPAYVQGGHGPGPWYWSPTHQ